ncbi:MAG: redox-sensing transcriptional repressor Rex [Candidatus Omnitrophica bacterium]|nr:redox-sensing transcriptional repressor Rex [Candidatus Omnitrophota bacterium]MCF7878493.1 redox-sensing transcriptional repressor Rex [Candidatus Omnitrophota bacterium]
MVHNAISEETIKRLSLYLRNLRKLKENGVKIISSDKVTKLLKVSSFQFRKDLSYFGEFGKRGVGYQIDKLIKEIEKILGINKQWKIVLIGAGRLGSALLGFEGFSRFNIRIDYAFDTDRNKIGKVKHGVKIYDLSDLKKIVKKDKIKLALVSTPPHVAQGVVDELVKAGVKGILNFVPVALNVPEGVSVSNVDMACELESLIFFCKEKKYIKS